MKFSKAKISSLPKSRKQRLLEKREKGRKKVKEIKKGKKYPCRVSERWEGKYSNKKRKIIIIKK